MLSPQYIGGFFDADGSVGIYGKQLQGKSVKRQVCITFTNTDLGILKRIKEVLSGSIQKKVRDNSTYWTLYAPASSLQLLIENTYTKRKELQLAKEYVKFNRTIVMTLGPKPKPDWMDTIQATYELAVKELKHGRTSPR
jgi:hypothetical protein